MHLIDVTSKDIEKNYLTIIREIKAYDSNLSKKKQILVLTKCDAVEDKKVKSAKEILTKLNVNNVINISSVSGLMGNPGQVNYSSSKAALNGFTKSLAKEVGSRNITVNNVAPGFIETDMTQVLPTSQKEALLSQIPLGRLGSAEEVAGTVAFLAGEEASYVTGTTLHVNGGMYMA